MADGDSDLLKTILILTAYIAPYFFIPAAFKLAGGLFANLAGVVNDKSRGLFDRNRKFRAGQYGKKWRDLKASDYYKHGPGRAFNRNLAGIATGTKGNFGLGRKGRQATAANARIAAAAAMKDNPKITDLAQNSDEGVAISALSGGTANGARQAHDELLAAKLQERRERNQARVQAGTWTQAQADADNTEFERNTRNSFTRGLAAASATGFSRTNANAALTLMGQNKSRAVAGGRMDLIRAGIGRLANNENEQADMVDGFNYQSRTAGRFDLGADTALAGFNRGSLYQVANGHEGSINGAATHVLDRINSGNATRDDFEDGAVLRLELDEVIRSATGPVRDAAIAQGQALDNSALRGFMDQVVARQERVAYNPRTHRAQSQNNPNGWTPQDIANGFRMEAWQESNADTLRSRARVYQREDPNILAQQQSDRRLKRNIKVITKLENGITLYKFQYLWSDQMYVGVMAQDLLKTHPEAVHVNYNGFYGVYYHKLGLKMVTIEEWEADAQTVHLSRPKQRVY